MTAVPDDLRREAEEAEAAERRALDESTDRGYVFPRVTEDLGLTRAKVEDFVRRDTTPREWVLSTDHGAVVLTGRDLDSPTRFRAALVEAADEVLPRALARPDHARVVGALLRVARVESVGEEATDAGLGRAWVASYLETRPPVDASDEAVATLYPFVVDGDVYLFGESLRGWLLRNRGERVLPKRMGIVLRAADCEPVRMLVAGAQRSLWRVPPSLQPLLPSEQANPRGRSS